MLNWNQHLLNILHFARPAMRNRRYIFIGVVEPIFVATITTISIMNIYSFAFGQSRKRLKKFFFAFALPLDLYHKRTIYTINNKIHYMSSLYTHYCSIQKNNYKFTFHTQFLRWGMEYNSNTTRVPLNANVLVSKKSSEHESNPSFPSEQSHWLSRLQKRRQLIHHLRSSVTGI